MTDYKQLCAELAEDLALWLEYDEPPSSLPIEEGESRKLLARVRVALAEPEPEWPTDEEIMELMPQQMRDGLAAAARALPGFDPDNIKASSVFRIILNRHVSDYVRAVLARWGTSNLTEIRSSLGDAPQPVPVPAVEVKP